MQSVRRNIASFERRKKPITVFLAIFVFCSLCLLAGTKTLLAAPLQATEIYEISFVSENLEGEPILGYVYELFDEEGGLLHTLDLRERNNLSLKLPAGSYEIREKIVPPAYVPYKESIQFSLPFVDKEGRTESLLIKPKHETRVSVTPTPTLTPTPSPAPRVSTTPGKPAIPRTGESTEGWALYAAASILSGVFLLFLMKKRRLVKVEVEEDRL